MAIAIAPVPETVETRQCGFLFGPCSPRPCEASGEFPLWVPGVEPGSMRDLTALRRHALPALYQVPAIGYPTLVACHRAWASMPPRTRRLTALPRKASYKGDADHDGTGGKVK